MVSFFLQWLGIFLTYEYFPRFEVWEFQRIKNIITRLMTQCVAEQYSISGAMCLGLASLLNNGILQNMVNPSIGPTRPVATFTNMV